MVIVFINGQTVCLLWNAEQSEKQTISSEGYPQHMEYYS